MKVSVAQGISNEDLILNSGDLIYEIDSEYFYQVIKLENNSYLLYNLCNHKYIELLKNNSENIELNLKCALDRLNSMFGLVHPDWRFKRRENYNITLNF